MLSDVGITYVAGTLGTRGREGAPDVWVDSRRLRGPQDDLGHSVAPRRARQINGRLAVFLVDGRSLHERF